MQQSFSNANMNKIGTCPHGMPPGACPICNGMGGGGGAKKADFSAKQGEMSWNECYAIGQLIKAQTQRADDAKLANQNSALNSLMATKIAMFMAEKFAAVRNAIMNSAVVSTISKGINNLKQVVVKAFKPAMNMIAKPFAAIARGFNAVKQGAVDIMDKLNAIFGEQKNALEKTVSDNLSSIKKKLFSLLGMVDTEMEQGEDEEEVELKRTLGLKKFREKLSKFFK